MRQCVKRARWLTLRAFYSVHTYVARDHGAERNWLYRTHILLYWFRGIPLNRTTVLQCLWGRESRELNLCIRASMWGNLCISIIRDRNHAAKALWNGMFGIRTEMFLSVFFRTFIIALLYFTSVLLKFVTNFLTRKCDIFRSWTTDIASWPFSFIDVHRSGTSFGMGKKMSSM